MDNYSIKNNILALRLEHKMSQEQMAQALGISRNAYRNIEKGETKLVSDMVRRIADWAGITPEEVLLGYIPSKNDSLVLRDMRDRYDTRLKDLAEDYELQMEHLRNENALLREMIEGKDDNIRTLRSMVSLLEKRLEDNKND